MKVLCKDRHYRKFAISEIGIATCLHCRKSFLWNNPRQRENINKQLKNHTCKARLKELKNKPLT